MFGIVAAFSPSARHRVGLFVVLGLLVILAWSRGRAAGDRPAFLWADDVLDGGEAVAFYLVRDVDLELAPGERLWAAVAGDERSTLWLNGTRIGAGTWRSGRPGALYELTDFLMPGVDRIVVEARSARGAGAVAVDLRRGPSPLDAESFLWTDRSWRVVRSAEPALLGGWTSLDALASEVPAVWGRGTAGRWRFPTELVEERLEPLPVPPRVRIGAERVRHPSATAWTTLRRRPLPRLAEVGIYDFGRSVTGILQMGLPCEVGDPPPEQPIAEPAPDARRETVSALLYFGSEPRAPEVGRLDEVLLAPPGACAWRDVDVRTFRYLTLVGVAPSGWIEVEEVGSDAADAQRSASLDRSGVFGLAPARRWLPIEEAVWRRLQVAPPGGEDVFDEEELARTNRRLAADRPKAVHPNGRHPNARSM
ncbi:MAG: hypothetical protein AAGN46_03910 [Acidobacteriota bacterium]